MKAPTIDLLHHTSTTASPIKQQFETWIAAACAMASPIIPADLSLDKSVTLVITHHDAMVELNQTFRQKNRSTNVLSFPDEPLPGETPTTWGDIVFCHETIQAETQDLGIPLMHHYAHLTVHGWLHLLGYDHEDNAEALLMESLETNILHTLGIPNPY